MHCGQLAQLGERLPYKQRVGGSSPSLSILNSCIFMQEFFCAISFLTHNKTAVFRLPFFYLNIERFKTHFPANPIVPMQRMTLMITTARIHPGCRLLAGCRYK